MMKICFSCKGELQIESAPGRGDECARCGADLKICRNCRHHDSSSYNECGENQAERVVEKERANFCDYFEFADTDTDGGKEDLPEDSVTKLKDLFK